MSEAPQTQSPYPTTHTTGRTAVLTADNLYRLRPVEPPQRFEIRQPDKNSTLAADMAKAATQLLDLQDQLYDVIAANHFYYEAVEAIAARYDESIDRKTQHGWATTSAWLEASQQHLLQTIDVIRLTLVSSEAEQDSEKTED